MKTETYEVRVTLAARTVMGGMASALPPIRHETQEAAQDVFAVWTGMPEGSVEAVELVRITTEVVARWPEPAPCPNCGGGGIDTITDDVGSTITQTCEDCLGTGRLPA